jgi:hypothetical protein
MTGHDRVATHFPPGNDDSHVWAGASLTSTCARHSESVRNAELTADAKPLT